MTKWNLINAAEIKQSKSNSPILIKKIPKLNNLNLNCYNLRWSNFNLKKTELNPDLDPNYHNLQFQLRNIKMKIYTKSKTLTKLLQIRIAVLVFNDTVRGLSVLRKGSLPRASRWKGDNSFQESSFQFSRWWIVQPGSQSVLSSRFRTIVCLFARRMVYWRR